MAGLAEHVAEAGIERRAIRATAEARRRDPDVWRSDRDGATTYADCIAEMISGRRIHRDEFLSFDPEQSVLLEEVSRAAPFVIGRRADDQVTVRYREITGKSVIGRPVPPQLLQRQKAARCEEVHTNE